MKANPLKEGTLTESSAASARDSKDGAAAELAVINGLSKPDVYEA